MNNYHEKIKQYSLVIILLVKALFFANQSIGQAVVLNPTSPWIVPAGVTSIKVEVWGRGGSGGGATGTGTFGFTVAGGGGGGGGAYTTQTLTVNPGDSYSITYGAAGATGTGNGGSGGATIFTGNAGTVTANGGAGGTANNGAGGNGGTGNLNGGTGGTGNTNDGANGGGGAGNFAKGNDGSTGSNTGTGGAGSPNVAPYIGGAGGGFTTGATGNAGSVPGGGGGGGRGNILGTGTGGAGGAGQVIISYTCPAATISYTSQGFCKSVTSAPAAINGSTGGTFSVIPAGLTINTSTGEINPSTGTAGTTYTIHYQIPAANGCSAVDATATVKINLIPVTSSTSTNITCNGANNGTITVTASGGASPYMFSDDNGASYQAATGTDLSLFTGLAPNNPYRIRVKDNNGCVSKQVQ